jgi:ferritin-like metal-binding protein YciE
MDSGQKKVVQYLDEAHATEQALVRVLQSQIAMTPSGSHRSSLELHLDQTRDHARRVAERLEALGQGSNPLTAVVGAAESLVGQALALGKTPFDLLRGSGGPEKVLKNAKDAAATEALEIATYTTIERLARDVGDAQTAELAASIRADEEQMLQRVIREIPGLTEAVVCGDIEADPSDDDQRVSRAAGAVREDGQPARNGARKKTAAASRTAPSKRTAKRARSPTPARMTSFAQPRMPATARRRSHSGRGSARATPPQLKAGCERPRTWARSAPHSRSACCCGNGRMSTPPRRCSEAPPRTPRAHTPWGSCSGASATTPTRQSSRSTARPKRTSPPPSATLASSCASTATFRARTTG